MLSPLIPSEQFHRGVVDTILYEPLVDWSVFVLSLEFLYSLQVTWKNAKQSRHSIFNKLMSCVCLSVMILNKSK